MGFLFSDPIEWFDFELKKVTELGEFEPTAMNLATCRAPERYPDVRVVLFKGWIRGGLSFYTNLNSPKAKSLQAFPWATANFFWPKVNQQIRIFGTVEPLTREENESYFSSRPRLSQLGAWASDQSQKLDSYEYLEMRIQEFVEQFDEGPIPCPPHWGGFRLVPLRFEFWFGRDGRLHERYVFERQNSNQQTWEKFMLFP
ncbi:MAG: pyridoxamine 5'-phosphate oxidase [Bdellovibrionaceae bacterium]|nr:pyridoxamine 5'-phosphate oxidase [Pseudobdellovibrionaceae bacterium]MDW8190519.1 pyridoxamine 5'-phosphate oxidase [Pseudobdellovibrionaceae bacterium]